MTGLEKVYIGCAILGGILFLLRLVLMIVGADSDADVDLDADADIDADAGDGGLGLFSLHGITSFFLVFGLAGLACIRDSNLSPGLSALIAFGAGTLMMFVVAFLLAQLYKLKSSGNINLENAIGEEGTIYLRIPENGTGKVQVVVQERMRIYDARCSSGGEIPTGDRVRVDKVLDNSILSVEKI